MSATLMRTTSRSRLFSLLLSNSFISASDTRDTQLCILSIYCDRFERSSIESLSELNDFVYGVEFVGRESCCWCLSSSLLQLCSAPTPNRHPPVSLPGESLRNPMKVVVEDRTPSIFPELQGRSLRGPQENTEGEEFGNC